MKHSWKLRELEKAVETLSSWLMFPGCFLFSQTFTCVSIKKLDYETQDFYCLIVGEGTAWVKLREKIESKYYNFSINVQVVQNFV